MGGGGRGFHAFGGRSSRGLGGHHLARGGRGFGGHFARNGGRNFRGIRNARSGRSFFAARAARNHFARNNRLAGNHFAKSGLGKNGLNRQQVALHQRNGFWNSRFGGRNFRGRFGRGFGNFWVGGIFWPYAFGDYFSYAFWPDDYYDSFWGFGPDAILWGAFWPYDDYGYGYGGVYGGDIYRPYRHRRHVASAKSSNMANTIYAADGCTGFAPGVAGLPLQRLEQIIEPTRDQRAAFDDLKAASEKASDILKQSCSSETPVTPVARLDAIEKRLQAMQQANDLVREPLERLYGQLTSAQKDRLNASSRTASSRRSRSASADVNTAQLCSKDAGFTDVPEQQIQKIVNLDDAQRRELEKLKAASEKSADVLKSSCPSTVPNTIDGRLDAAQKRVGALIEAVDTVKPAVRDFFASLTDEQRAALNAQAPSNKSASNNRG